MVPSSGLNSFSKGEKFSGPRLLPKRVHVPVRQVCLDLPCLACLYRNTKPETSAHFSTFYATGPGSRAKQEGEFNRYPSSSPAKTTRALARPPPCTNPTPLRKNQLEKHGCCADTYRPVEASKVGTCRTGQTSQRFQLFLQWLRHAGYWSRHPDDRRPREDNSQTPPTQARILRGLEAPRSRRALVERGKRILQETSGTRIARLCAGLFEPRQGANHGRFHQCNF